MSDPSAVPTGRPSARLGEPVLQASPRCPVCGRQNVVVFRPYVADPDRPLALVCLACAPRPAR